MRVPAIKVSLSAYIGVYKSWLRPYSPYFKNSVPDKVGAKFTFICFSSVVD